MGIVVGARKRKRKQSAAGVNTSSVRVEVRLFTETDQLKRGQNKTGRGEIDSKGSWTTAKDEKN